MRTLVAFLMATSSLAQTGPTYNWVRQVNGITAGTVTGLGADAAGNIYIAGLSNSHPYVTKLDSHGNILFTNSFGGSKSEQVTAMAVDANGNTYLTGTTFSADFPTTPNAWRPTAPFNGDPRVIGGSFLMRINPDGSLGFSTFFAPILISPHSLALGPDGSIYLAGSAGPPDSLPVTPGAYRTTCSCGWESTGFLALTIYDTFLARFDATGSKLIFATYLGLTANNTGYPFNSSPGQSVAVSADGSAYVANNQVVLLDASGSNLRAAMDPRLTPQSIALGPDGSVYVAGQPNPQAFRPTANALFPAIPSISLPGQGSTGSAAIAHLDAALTQTLAATYFASPYSATTGTLIADSTGNVYVGGATPPNGIPTALPLAQGFGIPWTGYVAELSPDLTALRFSSYFGDNEYFGISGIARAPDGSLVLAGATSQPGLSPAPGGNVWVNSISLGAPPLLRIDAVVNAASMLADPIAPGETLQVNGAGFSQDAQLLINGEHVANVSIQANHVTAVVPADLTGTYAWVQVQSGGSLSNQILVPVAPSSPALFSQDGSGLGQGLILNEEGTLNSPAHPAHIGDKITMFATGVGALTFTDGYANASSTPAVTIDGFYCPGVAAVFRPYQGLPADVYQLTVYVPDPAALIPVNPNLKGFTYPPQVPLVLRIGNGQSQRFLSISIAQ